MAAKGSKVCHGWSPVSISTTVAPMLLWVCDRGKQVYTIAYAHARMHARKHAHTHTHTHTHTHGECSSYLPMRWNSKLVLIDANIGQLVDGPTYMHMYAPCYCLVACSFLIQKETYLFFLGHKDHVTVMPSPNVSLPCVRFLRDHFWSHPVRSALTRLQTTANSLYWYWEGRRNGKEMGGGIVRRGEEKW